LSRAPNRMIQIMIKKMRIVFWGRVNEIYLYPESVTENCPASRLTLREQFSIFFICSIRKHSVPVNIPHTIFYALRLSPFTIKCRNVREKCGLVYLGTDVGAHGERFQICPLKFAPLK
ncbi:MAG: hypothetical protein ABFR35_08645, partial [Thermodesulfobacteriota bacterium]